jgi:hypothetical protein
LHKLCPNADTFLTVPNIVWGNAFLESSNQNQIFDTPTPKKLHFTYRNILQYHWRKFSSLRIPVYRPIAK